VQAARNRVLTTLILVDFVMCPLVINAAVPSFVAPTANLETVIALLSTTRHAAQSLVQTTVTPKSPLLEGIQQVLRMGDADITFPSCA
jgi:hypothetical protein